MDKDESVSGEEQDQFEEPAPESASGQQGINIGADTVTRFTADYPEEHRGPIRTIYAIVKDRGWTADQIKAETGISYSLLWRL